MTQGPESAPPADLLSDEDRHSPGLARPKPRPWVWGLGGAVLASAVWGAALQGVGYGRTALPDLHGFHIRGTLCTPSIMEPLTDNVTSGRIAAEEPEIREGPALDHIACSFASSLPTGDGWATAYAVSVTVDLHKKTDPRAEFEATYDPRASAAASKEIGDTVFYPDANSVTRPYPGLGDLAYADDGRTHESLSVLFGGAVISVTVDAINTWTAPGRMPTDADGSPERPYLVDSSSIRPFLAPTVRHLMGVLSEPVDGSQD
ncbi:hypothetical protein ACFO3J_23070 [Streptomyces polygonati]|uniref:Uncharacterized protein n=1 Tax=Streptomyces polygonati TaxID=1617087 RepID=A0ABV8HQQ6_9ACTN